MPWVDGYWQFSSKKDPHEMASALKELLQCRNADTLSLGGEVFEPGSVVLTRLFGHTLPTVAFAVELTDSVVHPEANSLPLHPMANLLADEQ